MSNTDGPFVPRPPMGLQPSLDNADPISRNDLEKIVKKYNEYVNEWNLYEMEKGPVQNPPKSKHGVPSYSNLDLERMYWTDDLIGRTCCMKVKGWACWVSGSLAWPWLRTPIIVSDVVWAGWKPKQAIKLSDLSF